MKRLIPAYTWHGQLMERLVAEKLQIGDIVVLNPDNGPCGPTGLQAHDIRLAIDYIKTKAAQPIGYVHLTYGTRNLQDVIDDIIAWNKFGIRDIFYDESSEFWDAAFLRRLTNLLYSQSVYAPIRTVFNMGTEPTNLTVAPYRSLVVTYEGAGLPPAGQRRSWEIGLAHSADGPLQPLDWTWSYATKDTLPNPYDGIPS